MNNYNQESLPTLIHKLNKYKALMSRTHDTSKINTYTYKIDLYTNKMSQMGINSSLLNQMGGEVSTNNKIENNEKISNNMSENLFKNNVSLNNMSKNLSKNNVSLNKMSYNLPNVNINPSLINQMGGDNLPKNNIIQFKKGTFAFLNDINTNINTNEIDNMLSNQ